MNLIRRSKAIRNRDSRRSEVNDIPDLDELMALVDVINDPNVSHEACLDALWQLDNKALSFFPALVAEIRRLRAENASLKGRLVIDNATEDRGIEAFYNQERTKLGWYHEPDERSAMRAALYAARRSPVVCLACSAPLNPEQIVIATSRGVVAKYCSVRCRETARRRRWRARKAKGV